MLNKEFSYQGNHAMGDLILNEYPKNIVQLFKESIRYSNLHIVDEKIKDFKEECQSESAVTGVFILSESHATIHEYPESNYVTVDIYTCGKEGDPMAALKYFKSLLNVKKYNLNLIKRGVFDE